MAGWKSWARLFGLALIVLACALAWRSGAVQSLYWPSLVVHEAAWAAWVAAHPVAAPVYFVATYAVSVALFLPVGLWLSLLGGLLFGAIGGTLYTVGGASAGALAAFLLARGLLAPFFASRLRRPIARLRPGLERDGFGYLLAIRLVPLFPFWLVNLAPALIGMRVLPYAAATCLGLVPASFVLNAVGAGLHDSLVLGAPPSAAMLLRPALILPLLAMAAMALLPMAWRRLRPRPDPATATTTATTTATATATDIA